MPTLSNESQSIPAEVTLVDVQIDEPWGEVWVAKHATHGDIFLVAYTRDPGKGLFAEVLPQLRRWKQLAGVTVPGLLAIHEIIEGPIPMLIVENGGRDSLAGIYSQGNPATPAPHTDSTHWGRDLAKIMYSVAKALVGVKTYEVKSAGMSPQTVMIPELRGDPKLLPIGPGARKHAHLISGGRYSPPEAAGTMPLDEVNADSFALAWTWIECELAREFPDRDRKHLEEVPFARLRTLLGNSLKPVAGKYPDPKLFEIGIDRWTRVESLEDIAEIKERFAAQERTPMQQKLATNRTLLVRAGIAAGVLVAVLLAVFVIPKMFATSKSTNTPYGVLGLFGDALIARDVTKAKSFTSGEATPQTERLLADVQRMETANLASKFSAMVPSVAGDGAVRTVKMDLKGASGDVFMQAEATVRQNGDAWTIEALYFKPLRGEGAQ